jgi:hypothetical protein
MENVFGNIKRARPRYANDGDAAFANRGGNGCDCVVHELVLAWEQVVSITGA